MVTPMTVIITLPPLAPPPTAGTTVEPYLVSRPLWELFPQGPMPLTI